MSSEEQRRPEFTDLAERDRQAWNLPSARPQPVGPVKDVWPVRPGRTQGDEDLLPEDPAAA
jgi:hypothetical protein